MNAPLRRAVTIEEIASALAGGAAPPDGRMSLALRAFFEECAPETQIVFLHERGFTVDAAIRVARALGVASDAWVLNL